jgi:type IV pilus assembly protein PilO
MAALDLKLEEKKWYFALGIGLLLALVLAGVVQYLWFSGINDELKRKRVELDGLNQEIQKGRAAERKLSQFREEVKRLELELGKLLLILPSQRNTEELIKRVEALTRQGDFSLKKFTPGEFVRKDFYSEWPIDIQLDGTYHNLALFFDRMSRFSRIVNVEELKINGLENQPGKSIAASFVAKTFIYTADDEGQSKTGGKGGPAKPGTVPGAGAASKLKDRASGKGID